MKRILFLALFATQALAGGYGQQPSVENSIESGAYAQGGTQSIQFNSPGRQDITYRSAPGLGSNFVPSPAQCQLYMQGQGSWVAAAFGLSVPSLDYWCKKDEHNKNGMAIGVAATNAGVLTGNGQLVQEAYQVMSVSLYSHVCGDPDGYIQMKARGFKCPVAPSPRFTDMFPGGMPRETEQPLADFQPVQPYVLNAGQPPTTQLQPQNDPYVTRKELDNAFQKSIGK